MSKTKGLNRDELVEVAWQAWLGGGPTARDGVVAAVDAVEPMIRQDAVDGALADLRAKVKADRDELNRRIKETADMWGEDQVDQWACERIALNRVLALFEEAPGGR